MKISQKKKISATQYFVGILSIEKITILNCKEGRTQFWRIIDQCYISIPSENIRKTEGFLTFSGNTERKHWAKIG